jgi:hypothetical protein
MQLPPWLRPVPSSYPLDRADLLPGEWDFDSVLAEARADGWWVTKSMLNFWIKKGWVPPPRQ